MATYFPLNLKAWRNDEYGFTIRIAVPADYDALVTAWAEIEEGRRSIARVNMLKESIERGWVIVAEERGDIFGYSDITPIYTKYSDFPVTHLAVSGVSPRDGGKYRKTGVHEVMSILRILGILGKTQTACSYVDSESLLSRREAIAKKLGIPLTIVRGENNITLNYDLTCDIKKIEKKIREHLTSLKWHEA
ncbi:MAG: hypothetical protein ABH829_01615 [archaeon]